MQPQQPQRLPIRMRFIAVLVSLGVAFSGAGLPGAGAQPALDVNAPEAPPVAAHAAVLMDFATGRVLAAKNPHARMEPASITKIMTAVVALEHGDLDAVIEFPTAAANVEGSKVHFRPGDPYTLAELLYGLMLESGNDAAIAIALHVAGSVAEFANLMNETARRIGAVNTHFTNPHGLPDPDHYTTAYDMALITQYAYRFPEFAAIVAAESYTLPYVPGRPARTLYNGNRALGSGGIDGVKTGYTQAAQHTYVASASREGNRLIAVVLRTHREGKWEDALTLIEYGFANYRWVPVIEGGREVDAVPVDGGEEDEVAVVPRYNMLVPVRPGEEASIRVERELVPRLAAPVDGGTVVGHLAVYIEAVDAERPLVTVDLVTARRVEARASLWMRVQRAMVALLSGAAYE